MKQDKSEASKEIARDTLVDWVAGFVILRHGHAFTLPELIDRVERVSNIFLDRFTRQELEDIVAGGLMAGHRTGKLVWLDAGKREVKA